MLRWIMRLYLLILIQILSATCSKSSLTFVIDDTSSMYDDISQVKEAAGAIMDIVLREKKSEIEDVILVTFNDIDWANPNPVKLRKKTSNKYELLEALNSIVVYGGGDCPEYALKGLELALEESKPGSYLFVFTDASAKDYYELNKIKSLCEKKQSQVIFVLTGHCTTVSSPDYRVYYDIAKASSGQVFAVDKNEVKYVVEIIKETVKDRKSVLTWVTIPPVNSWTPVPFTVDDKTEYVVISTSGQDVDLHVLDGTSWYGHRMPTEQLLWRQSGKVVKFYAPNPGVYTVWVIGKTDVTIVVYARTDFTFDHGFSEFVPKSLADASKLPIANRKHHLSISVTDPEHTVDIKSAEILDMNGNVITQLLLRKANGDFYITDTFVSPSTMFKIQVTGIVKKTGKTIKRISKTAIEPQIPPPPVAKAPVVTISEGARVDVDYAGEILLTCKVSGYPTPEIIWTSTDSSRILTRQSNVVEPPYEYISYLKLSNVQYPGTYYCKANNNMGSALSKIDVKPLSPFKVETSHAGKTSVKFGEEKKLTCGISSTHPYDIKWNTPLNPSDYTLSADKKVLTIKKASIASQGSYSCEATLKSNPMLKQTIATNVVISDLAPPSLSPHMPSTITTTYGKTIQIWCKIAGGVPRPTVRWQFMMHHDNVYKDLPVKGEQISISQASSENAGEYRCIANNDKGQATKSTKVIVQRAPVVAIQEGSKITIAYGSSAKLTCKIIAFPLPKVSWKNSRGNEITSKDKIVNNEITSHVTLQNVRANDRYSCFAENILGKNVSSVDILVTSPFVVQSHPEGVTMVNKYGAKTDVPCGIKSSFPMKIRWFKSVGSAKSEIHASDKYTISPTGDTLHILHTDLDTTGKYTCEASLVDDINQKTDVTAEVKIDDLSPPVLQGTGAKKMIVQNKERVKITCNIASGTPPPVVSWQVMKKGDRVLTDLSGSGQELVIDSATLNDAGQYKCIAKNAIGETDKITELVVQKAPEVSIDEGATVTVTYGSTTDLKCRVVGYPLPRILWKDTKGHVLTSEDTINNYEVTSRLKVQNIRANTYSCYAENDLGMSVARIQVFISPSIVFPANLPETTSVKYGDPTTISCDAKSSFPIKIKWFYQKNGQSEKSEIHASDKYMISPDARKLHIKSTDLDLVGKYTCEAFLTSDKDEKNSFTTEVKINNLKAPEITSTNKTITIMNGQKMSIPCEATGVPKPVIKWQVKPVNSNEFVAIRGQGESVKNTEISYEWAGLYRCTATNELGAVNFTTEVIVHGEPNITNTDSTYVGVTGDRVLKIPCEVSGVPEPVIGWRQGSKAVTSDDKIIVTKDALYIKYPSEKDSSNFTCEAKNIYGTATKTFEATISDFVFWNEDHNTVLYLKPGESADIKCLSPHSDSQSVRWYVNGEKITSIGTIYKLRNAKFENDGNYTCRVNTDQGSESLNYVVDVGYKPTFKMMLPPTVHWNGNNKESLDCDVNAKPRGDVKWSFNGKELKDHSVELPIFSWGTYSCQVSNVHGSVMHTYNVTSDGCIVNRTAIRGKHIPLLIGDKASTWPQFDHEDEFLTINKNQKITLECSTRDQPANTFKSHPLAKKIHAECLNQDNFIVDGEIFKFEELECMETVRASEVFTNKSCMETSKTIEIGFRLSNGFLGAYNVCYSDVDHKTLFTKVDMFDVNLGNKVDLSVNLNEGIKTGNKNPGEIIKSCRYNQRWFVSPEDVAFGPAQTATLMFDKYNKVPVYEPCDGSSRVTWTAVETTVQSTLLSMYTLTTWTGARNYDSKGIPRYLWKVVKFEDNTYETIVYVNGPNPGSGDILCPGITVDRFSDITNADDQYTYSCSLNDFMKTFNVPKSDFEITD